ncbi:MAG: excinuclease ABC subunit UvrC [Myxococcales bacterium]|nr:excinuclease ABC subunit UvrC [Myxococcales bacterium]
MSSPPEPPSETAGGAIETEPSSSSEDVVAGKLARLPPSPGCYVFLDKEKKALYVGKAKSLRSRVRSYFQESGSDERYFIPLLRRLVVDIDTIVTGTEKEAAVLENELIKRHQPRFNVKLRDDKDFLCLRLDEKKDWPRLETVRRPSPDGARYFGPYHSATSARRTLHLVNKHFHLRTCSDADFASRKRPCLQYQIKRCPGPCVYEVEPTAYRSQVHAVSLFLEGRHDELTRELAALMKESSRTMEFERAAVYRDQLRAVESIRENQRVVSVSDVDQDVIGLYREGANVEIDVLFVRAGRVTDTVSYSLRKIELPDEEVLANFLTQFYGGEEDRGPIPEEVLLPALPDGVAGVSEWLSERRGRKVELYVPQRGPRKKLLDMAIENARHTYKSKERAAEDVELRLEELRERLRLPTLPRRIECCDISHLGGGDTVGAVVALKDGAPDKKRYRSFHVKGAGGGDDYAAMYEVLERRFRRGKAAREEAAEREETGRDADWELPDLFVVDGGRGQLNVALTAARDLGLHDLSIVGLAKERENVAGDKLVDRVYLPGQKNGIPLKTSSSALFFLARARDEAHRFANEARKKLGGARRLRSALDDVPGVGDKTRAALLKFFGSVEGVRAASEEALLAVPGVNKRHVAAIVKWREAAEPSA